MNNGINPESVVPLGTLAELTQDIEDQEMRDAASRSHYVGGYSNGRRQKNAVNPKHSWRALKREKQEAAPRAEGPVGAPWWKNPAWWIAGALILKAFKK